MKTLLRLIPAFFLTFFFTYVTATNYTFTGSGEWTDANNWAGGITPWAGGSGGLTATDTITVSGTTGIGVNCTFNCPYGTLSSNTGTIIIAVGGSLTFQNYTQFAHQGKLIVNGTMINKTTFEVYPGSTTTVNGILINQKTIDNKSTFTINNGGSISNQLTGIFTNTGFTPPYTSVGILIINSGGTFTNKNTAVFKPGNSTTNQGTIDNQSTLSGNATITGSLTNGGTIAPGNSPGTYSITGDYTATSTAIHNFEVGGTTAGNYDVIAAGGNVTLDGTLNVSLINGFTPAANHDLPIITGNISGTFATVNKPSSYIVVYTSTSVLLRHLVGLPVSFVSFDLKKEAGGVKLMWNIQHEVNVSRYEIERSHDGKNFKQIGEVNAASINLYSFIDDNPEAISFYRIKVIDRDGKYNYSIIITYMQGKGLIALRAFPSPATGETSVQHTSAIAGSRITLNSIDGRLLQIIHPSIGEQKTAINLSSINAGVYIIKYEDGMGQTESIKITKL